MPREEPKAYIPTGRTPLRPPTTKTPSSCPSHAVIPMPCHRLTKYDPSIPSLPSSPTHHPNHAIPMPREEPKAYIPTGRKPLRPHPQNTLIPPLPLRQSGLRAGIQSPEAGPLVLSASKYERRGQGLHSSPVTRFQLHPRHPRPKVHRLHQVLISQPRRPSHLV